MEKYIKNPQKRITAKKEIAASSDGVQERITSHFIIFYVTEGQHAIKTSAYIDSLAKYLEEAYDFHKNTLGMKSILGPSRTDFYDKVVPSGLYPIAVMDIGVWEKEYENDPDYCGTFGMTSPSYYSRTIRETQIFMENDFIYGAGCPAAGKPFRPDYLRNWHLALKVTVYHELYHSFQFFHLAQFNFYTGNTFWMEASAAGVEEMGAPEVNDYISYLPSVFYSPGKSMNNLVPENGEQYAYATLYLFLSFELGLKFDSYIWDYYEKYPQKTFAEQLALLHANSQREEGEDIEDLFHKYATHVFYSGTRAASSPYPPFSADMQDWPDWRPNNTFPRYLRDGTFDYIRTTPYTDSVARISSLKLNDNDSIWVLSRLLSKEFVPPLPLPPPLKEFAAYPNPWKPKRSEKVKFGPLPANSTGVEIRSANGALLKRFTGEMGDTLTWQPEKLPAPGILYYRTLPYGKNKILLLEH